MSRQPMPAADAAWLHVDRPTDPMVVNGGMRVAHVAPAGDAAVDRHADLGRDQPFVVLDVHVDVADHEGRRGVEVEHANGGPSPRERSQMPAYARIAHPMRLLALEPAVSRGATAAERSLLALIALVLAATTARAGVEVAALAEAAWGAGQLLVEVRSEHPALAAPATAIALTAATVAYRKLDVSSRAQLPAVLAASR